MFPAWQAPEFERQPDIIRYRPPGKQIGFLKDKRHTTLIAAGDFWRQTFHCQCAGRRRNESGEKSQ